jgi:putrescine:ornithine antiporter
VTVQETKKMSLVQLTFIVAVNMMGSGIIMLPANMAQVGAISLLSWGVTAVGSMAIAYGFAQAGIFNQRAGGMAAYAEDAYGKDGYFQVFFLYFLSLAIGNVAIGISAVGYLATFIPWLASTPIATTIGVIALLWLTTVANFGGPSVTGKIGSITVWGVILPVGLLSIIGWFWFDADVFRAAWNPQGLSLGAGVGSSISLTLWAFLGMESAAQNSAAVENPKRDVPLACLFGTLGAAVIYILSTTVIQGIVPNADLAQSTGPFGLAYARMFNPTIGTLIMGLAVLACLGSLLGWQFTIAQTGKSAAEEKMFPAFFSKVNKMGAPLIGMLVLGVVQSLLALSTISPTLSEQFSALVNLAVVTNVIPYVVALSALMVMMKSGQVPQGTYRRNVVIALIAMVYSVYALYASGKDAVMGGMLVMGLAYIIWGFIAPRFVKPAATAAKVAALVIALLAVASPSDAQRAPAAPATTLERIKAAGQVRLGYRTDARPFSYRDESGNAAGYSVTLCLEVVDAIKAEAGLPALKVEWVPVTLADRFSAVQQGQIDLLCGADAETLARRADVAFSIPIFPGGIGALLRADAPARLKEILSGQASTRPNWRAQAGQLLQVQTFAVIAGTTAEPWLAGKQKEFRLTSKVTPVKSYDAGVQQVMDRKANVFFGDRAILLDAAARHVPAGKLIVLDRYFTYESVALAMARGDEGFRLLVDRSLSRFYASGKLPGLYVKWFGEPGENALTFFRWNALPE